MAFKVLLRVNAARALRKLDEATKARMKKALDELIVGPYKLASSYILQTFGAKDRRLPSNTRNRPDQSQVTVLCIDHREKVYNDLSNSKPEPIRKAVLRGEL